MSQGFKSGDRGDHSPRLITRSPKSLSNETIEFSNDILLGCRHFPEDGDSTILEMLASTNKSTRRLNAKNIIRIVTSVKILNHTTIKLA
jgi:hypothetical protein